MRKFFKVLGWIIIVILLIAIGFLVYLYFFKPEQKDPFERIPSDAVFIVETENLSKGFKALSQTEFWQSLTNSEYLVDFKEDVDYIDTLFNNNKTISLLLEDRKLLLSIHPVNLSSFDILFLIDLKSTAKLAFVTKAIKLLGFSIREIPYKNYKILELEDNESGDKFYVSFIDNILAASLSFDIIKNSIDIDEDAWKYNLKFQQVNDYFKTSELFSFYVNYSKLPEFYNIFADDPENSIYNFSQSLFYSAFDLEIEGDNIILTGFSNINDSLNSYLKSISLTKPFQIKAHSIISSKTAAYISINFNDFMEFYNNLVNEYHVQNPGELESYQKQLKTVENILGIKLEDDFFSWFGNEIMLLKVRPFPGFFKDEWMMLIHTNNKNYAREKLQFIMDKIDENSPFRYKTEEYRNFSIGFLNVGALFKILFGKLFASFDKPYFTVIEDFVVFANSRELLLRFIDDYLRGDILYQTEYYQDVYNELSFKSNITAYLNIPNFYQYLYSYCNTEQRKMLKEKKELILSFSDIACQLTTEKGLLKTSVLCNYNENSAFEFEVAKMEEAAEMEINNEYYEDLEFIPQVPKAQNPGNGKYTDYFEENVIRIEGLFKDSLMNNIWTTYYETGNIESTVNYKDGKAGGAAYFYYNDEKQTLQAEMEFDENKITGVFKLYYSDGSLKAIINYSKGTPDGEVFYYYPDGSVKVEGNYKNGKKKGKWKVFSPQGELMTKE